MPQKHQNTNFHKINNIKKQVANLTIYCVRDSKKMLNNSFEITISEDLIKTKTIENSKSINLHLQEIQIA
jgi:hypothetical protein